MKQLFFLSFWTLSTIVSLAQKQFFTEIDFATYSGYKVIDTLLSKGSFLVTKRKKSSRFNEYKECIQIDYGNRKRYFVLEYDAHFVNDTTIYAWGPPFKSTSTEGAFMKNGLWVYTTFYKEERNESLFSTEQSGMRFVVDSIPQTWDFKKLPTNEGIYFYKDARLVQVSKVQSEEVFYSLKKNGFYFFPETGRLFTKHHIREIK